MKIVGQMSITNFPLWEKCLNKLSNHVDELYLRFDERVGNPEILKTIQNSVFLNGKIKQILVSSIIWNRWNWREEQLRMLDNIKPDVVLTPDQDEIFCEGIDNEIQEFWNSPQKGMMFSYTQPMPTDDGRIINNGIAYPSKPHMKIYKWIEGLAYHPYMGFAKVTNYYKPELHWMAKTKIDHLCYYTKNIEQEKRGDLTSRFAYEKIHGRR